jgi:hypothetical protein
VDQQVVEVENGGGAFALCERLKHVVERRRHRPDQVGRDVTTQLLPCPIDLCVEL